ncbi:MAG TPA: site-2 protease family protein [Caulobacteraceae bacterium]|jgi:Zn-dependent protease
MADAPDTFVSPWADPDPAPAAEAAPTLHAAKPSRTQELLWGLLSTLLLAGWIGLWAGWLGALALVGGVFVHEFGHLMVINWAGAGPSRIRIIPFFGGAATMTRAPDSEFKGVLIALAGPAFGLIAALPFFVAAALTGQRWWIAGAFYVGALNLINLAPAAPLDGANALGPALARIHPLLERGALLAIALAGLAWALQRGSVMFALVIAFGVARAFLSGSLRPASRPLTWLEWVASIGLYLLVVAACAAVTFAAVQTGAINLRSFGFGGLR